MWDPKWHPFSLLFSLLSFFCYSYSLLSPHKPLYIQLIYTVYREPTMYLSGTVLRDGNYDMSDAFAELPSGRETDTTQSHEFTWTNNKGYSFIQLSSVSVVGLLCARSHSRCWRWSRIYWHSKGPKVNMQTNKQWRQFQSSIHYIVGLMKREETDWDGTLQGARKACCWAPWSRLTKTKTNAYKVLVFTSAQLWVHQSTCYS